MKEKQPETFDGLTKEFGQWRLAQRNRELLSDSDLWNVFLLDRPYTSRVYVRVLGDAIDRNNREIARLIKAGLIEDALCLAMLTNSMEDKRNGPPPPGRPRLTRNQWL